MSLPSFRHVLLLGVLAAARVGGASPVFEGYTVINGQGYAFELKTPRGWYGDDEAGRSQGLNVVYYPTGHRWDEAPAVCYVRVRTLDGTVTRIDDQVRDTLRNLRENGAPNAQVRFVRTITTQDASKARVYHFSGDRFGNREAAAYVQAKTTVQFVTLSARDDASFQSALPAFEALVSSYEDLTKPPASTPAPALEDLDGR